MNNELRGHWDSFVGNFLPKNALISYTAYFFIQVKRYSSQLHTLRYEHLQIGSMRVLVVHLYSSVYKVVRVTPENTKIANRKTVRDPTKKSHKKQPTLKTGLEGGGTLVTFLDWLAFAAMIRPIPVHLRKIFGSSSSSEQRWSGLAEAGVESHWGRVNVEGDFLPA